MHVFTLSDAHTVFTVRGFARPHANSSRYDAAHEDVDEAEELDDLDELELGLGD